MEKSETMEVYTVKVLHTNFLRGWGGQSNRILTECIGLAENGWDVLVSAPGESQLIRRAADAGLAVDTTVRYVGGLRAGVVKDVIAMRRLLDNFQPDIIHLHGGRDSWAYAKATLLTPRERRPIAIRTKHNIFPVSDHPLNRWQYGKCFDSIVAISSAIARQMTGKRYIDPAKVVIIPSAIDAERFRLGNNARQEARAELGYGEQDIVIGITGRLRREKAHDVLFKAVPLVVQRCPRARFVCFGSGSLGGDLAASLETAGMTSYVQMAGFRSDVPRCLAALDIYTQPSRSEGLGTSVLEAGAAGLPVVASDSGGIPDIIRHEQTGLLVPVEDHEALADALVRLASDESLRSRLAVAVRKHVERVYSVKQLVWSTDEHYRNILSRHGKPLP